ncbi:hypothetical protein [Streptomyces sp. NPDC053048]|uniref:hypothetical protein n=1 Tax=Streptomyces sp. NPDC053048 TaxID=3365694 RepID=UPI0037D83331
MLRRSVTAVVGALALVLALPGPAPAATGGFLYTAGGRPDSLLNPAGGKCVDVAKGATLPTNMTDAPATLFEEPGCESDVLTLTPGQTGGRVSFRSVRFAG